MQKLYVVYVLFLISITVISTDICVAKGWIEELESKSSTTQKIQIPSKKKIAQDIIGCTFQEHNENGYFQNINWKFSSDDEIDIDIEKIKKIGNVFHYHIKMTVTFPSRGCYIFMCRVGYAMNNGYWEQDYFVCDNILPKQTGMYTDLISTNLVGHKGERNLKIKNFSNVRLAVLGVIRYEYSNDYKKIAVAVDPNDEISIGGLFLGSIAEYKIHYVERR